MEDKREIFIKRLKEDLIGPLKEDEILESNPLTTYLNGILYPSNLNESDENDDEVETVVKDSDTRDESRDKIVNNKLHTPVIEFANQGPQLKLKKGKCRFAITGNVAFNILRNENIIEGAIPCKIIEESKSPRSVFSSANVKAPIIAGKESSTEITIEASLSICKNLDEIIVVADRLAPGIKAKH